MSNDRAGSSKTTQPDASNNAPQGRPFPIYWSQFPSIKILRQPKGRYSPQVDERCFTYCSQSIRGRTESREPWCRTICLRHIFAHEVTRVLAAHDGQKATVHSKYPLPPEGQNIPGLIETIVGESSEDQAHADDEVKHWDEGYYLWLSKSRWAAQEKMDLMMTDLEKQAEWQRYKQRLTETWEQQERQKNLRGAVDDGVPKDDHAFGNSKALAQDASEIPIPIPLRRPFPDLTGESILLPVPPPFPPIREQISNLLAPSHKLMELTQESIHTGAQWKFAQRIWEKAFTNEPFVLAQNVCSRMWEKWKKGPPDESL